MAAITTPSVPVLDAASSAEGRTTSLRGITVVAGAVAAAAATTVAAVAHAAGVPFAIDGEMIPLLGFAQMSFLGAVLGGVLAGSLRKRSTAPQRRFLQATAVLTALSCVPSVALPPDTATRLCLVLTHVVAAVVVIPVLARRLAA